MPAPYGSCVWCREPKPAPDCEDECPTCKRERIAWEAEQQRLEDWNNSCASVTGSHIDDEAGYL